MEPAPPPHDAPGTSQQQPQQQPLTIYSVGHSSRTVADLAAVLGEHRIRTLVDVSWVLKGGGRPVLLAVPFPTFPTCPHTSPHPSLQVRTSPRSRANPQFKRDALPAALAAQPGACGYEWLGRQLGGLRSRNPALGDLNAGWHTAAFRGERAWVG
jgi:hypothetical protein